MQKSAKNKKQVFLKAIFYEQQSINKQFAEFTISNLNDFNTELLDLNDFELPLYSIDREKDHGNG